MRISKDHEQTCIVEQMVDIPVRQTSEEFEETTGGQCVPTQRLVVLKGLSRRSSLNRETGQGAQRRAIGVDCSRNPAKIRQYFHRALVMEPGVKRSGSAPRTSTLSPKRWCRPRRSPRSMRKLKTRPWKKGRDDERAAAERSDSAKEMMSATASSLTPNSKPQRLR